MTEKKQKYLSIQLAGHKPVYAYLNKDRESGSNQPHFKGNGVAVWINEPKEDEKQPETAFDKLGM